MSITTVLQYGAYSNDDVKRCEHIVRIYTYFSEYEGRNTRKVECEIERILGPRGVELYECMNTCEKLTTNDTVIEFRYNPPYSVPYNFIFTYQGNFVEKYKNKALRLLIQN